MKQLSFLVLMVCMCVACSTDNEPFYVGGTPGGDIPGGTGDPNGGNNSPTDLTSSAELFNFDVELDDSFLKESETIDADDDDYVENTKFAETVRIVFDGNSVTYDAINSASHMYISGGDIWAVSSINDGIDSNGNMYISGGTVISFGVGEDGLDVIEGGTLSITGGTVFSLGNTCMTTPSSRTSTQEYIYKQNVTGLSSGTEVKLMDGTTTLFDYTMPFTFSRAYMILSLPELKKGESYTFAVGDSQETVSV